MLGEQVAARLQRALRKCKKKSVSAENVACGQTYQLVASLASRVSRIRLNPDAACRELASTFVDEGDAFDPGPDANPSYTFLQVGAKTGLTDLWSTVLASA